MKEISKLDIMNRSNLLSKSAILPRIHMSKYLFLKKEGKKRNVWRIKKYNFASH